VNIHDNIHFDATLLACMVELLMELLPDEYNLFLDTIDTEIFMLELASLYRQNQKRAPSELASLSRKNQKRAPSVY